MFIVLESVRLIKITEKVRKWTRKKYSCKIRRKFWKNLRNGVERLQELWKRFHEFCKFGNLLLVVFWRKILEQNFCAGCTNRVQVTKLGKKTSMGYFCCWHSQIRVIKSQMQTKWYTVFLWDTSNTKQTV